ncbi:hypothetical protein [Lysobacter sp. H23M47]|uniref:hypothetical protein n=1 Tax=Lysobacter sp. H23M47 TaxID=2781024 RepID=UPI00187F64D8|nr:hypothetical protein [Lysobacter sp. H23M47]QOW24030.1 hypothetical protein INQ43_09905 [Lysobacter sp. H23M47]
MSKRESENMDTTGYVLPEDSQFRLKKAGKRRLVFGVTLEQMDELDRLLAMITAHGDVVFSAHDADLAIGTLPLVGHAIFDDAIAAKDIIGQVTSQRLGRSPKPRSGIREERAIYGARTAGRSRHDPAGLMVSAQADSSRQQDSVARH